MHGISFCKVNYQLPENWLWLANMFEDDNIRVSFEELERLNLSSIQLADGSGAIASLSVFHSLHCLVIQHRQCLDPNTQSNPMKKKIKRWTYREYYFPNADADTVLFESAHASKFFISCIKPALLKCFRPLHRIH